MATQPQIFIGTAGWSYPDWEGVVYPRRSSGAGKLQTVAGSLDCVEIDSSFYHPPSPQMAANWLKNSPHGFHFLAKAWQRFTHERATRWSQTDLELLTRGLEPLRSAGQLDALLLQFPWSFRNNSQNQDWLQSLADDLTGWPLAVEFRHDSWLDGNAPALLAERNISFCNIDQPTLNHCLAPTAIVTTGLGYYRLHGRNAKNWFREKQDTYGGRYDYLYNDMELDELVTHIRSVARKTKRTFVILNNHKDGKAFANALQLKAKLQPEATKCAPATVLARYPELRKIGVSSADEQLPLI